VPHASGGQALRRCTLAGGPQPDPEDEAKRERHGREKVTPVPPRRKVVSKVGTLREIAPAVHWLALGKGLRAANVYLVGSGASWSLIDAGWPGDAKAVRRAAVTLFGGAPPAAILITHVHPDHSGGVPELASVWGAPVWVHPDELALAQGRATAVRDHAGPLDRWVVLPALRLTGARRMEATLKRSSLQDVARPFDPSAGVPGLPDWDAVPTPGHTPGHVAFVRREDRVAITGDALVTVDLNSPRGLLLQEPRVAGAPWYTTWDRRKARISAVALAELQPRVVAGGHGVPMTGLLADVEVRAFLDRQS